MDLVGFGRVVSVSTSQGMSGVSFLASDEVLEQCRLETSYENNTDETIVCSDRSSVSYDAPLLICKVIEMLTQPIPHSQQLLTMYMINTTQGNSKQFTSRNTCNDCTAQCVEHSPSVPQTKATTHGVVQPRP